jgi:hypothetical protein
MRSGGTPNLASTPASSSTSLLMVLTSVHMRTDQLRQILVAGRHHHLDALRRRCLRGQRADHVVGLDAVDASAAASRARRWRHAAARSGAPCRRASAGGWPCTRVPVVAEGLALGVENAGLVGDVPPPGSRFRGGAACSARHAARPSARARRAQVGHGVEGAVKVGRSVDQQQGRHRQAWQGRKGGERTKKERREESCARRAAGQTRNGPARSGDSPALSQSSPQGNRGRRLMPPLPSANIIADFGEADRDRCDSAGEAGERGMPAICTTIDFGR